MAGPAGGGASSTGSGASAIGNGGAHAITAPRLRVWWLVRETVATCFRYRVTGLAAEAGFFALLSLPPLIFGLFALLGVLPDLLGEQTVADIRSEILRRAERALTPDIVNNTIAPTLDDVLVRPRTELVSLGFLLSLWSGSRAVNVFVDTVSIMYGLGGRRGIIRQRSMSFGLYVLGLILGAVLIPLVLAGPGLVKAPLPARIDPFVDVLYWPVVVLLTVPSLALLYHVSIPVRTKWARALPGAALALGLWVLVSFLLRRIIAASVGSTSIYGPLSTPIVVLIWLYGLAIAVLIGAALNAAADRIWAERATFVAREQERRRTRAEAAARVAGGAGGAGGSGGASEAGSASGAGTAAGLNGGYVDPAAPPPGAENLLTPIRRRS